MADEFTRTMLQAVQRIPRASRFLRNMIFGPRPAIFSDTSKVTVDYYKGGRKLAPIVHRNIGGKMVDKIGFTSTDFEAPLSAPRDIYNEKDLEKRLPGEPDYSGVGIQDRMASYLALKVFDFTQMLERLEEWMVATQLVTGKLTLVGEGYSDEIDLTHTNKFTPTTPWNDAAGDPIADLSAWKIAVGEASGVMPNVCVMAGDVFATFMANAKVQAAYDKRNIMPGMLQPEMTPDGEVISVGYIPSIDMWLYVYSAAYDLAGTSTKYIPADTLVLFPSFDRNSFQMYYGACWDADLDQSFRVDRYPRFFTDPAANAKFFELQSRPLPILREVASWGVADTITVAEEG